MRNILKEKGYKWLSAVIVIALIFQILPVSGLSPVSAEKNDTEQVNNETREQVSKITNQEIISKRTENSKTFLNADGSFKAEISQKPIHFKNKSNLWETIDNELVTNSVEQVYENKANAFKVKFDQKLTSDLPFMELEDEQGSVNLQLEPLEHTNKKPATVEGKIDGQSITYSEVFPSIDMKYTVGADRIKEDIIYTEKPEEGFPAHFTYKMDLEGMKVQKNEGTIYLYDSESNIPLYYFDSPYMFDSYKPKGFQSVSEIDSIPEEAISYEIQLEYEVIDKQLFLYVIPNKKWLEDPSRTYPVTIDPTLVKLQSTPFVEDTNIRSGFPTQTGGNDLELGVGRSSTNVIRGLLKFNLSSIPSSTTIMDANLNLWQSSAKNDTAIAVSVHRLTKGWEENQASWNYAKTSPSTPWTVKGGDFVSTPLSTISGIGPVGDLMTGEMSWDIPTSLISNWVSTPANNHGVILKSDSESVDTYKKFISSEYSIDSMYHPLLVVTYKSSARLGLEDYWAYDTHPLVGGNSFTNLTTGNNVIQYQDFHLPSRGDFGFDFNRTYNAKSLEKSIFGYGWTASGLESLFVNGSENTIDYTDNDGTTHTFTYDAMKNLYKPGPGSSKSLRKYSSFTGGRYEYYYELLDKYGKKTIFKINKIDYNTDMQIARLEYIEDRHGNRITFKYDANNRLQQIASQLTTDLVKVINFTYNAAGLVETASYEGNIFKYEYDSSGKVKLVKQLKGVENGVEKYSTTNFEYTNNRISAIVDPNTRRTDFTYSNEMLTKVQEPDISQEIDEIDRPGTDYSVNTTNKISTVTDPLGHVTTYETNMNYVVEKVVSGGIETIYKLDPNYNIIEENTNGSITSKTYDPSGNGNLLTTTDPELNTQTFTYTSFSNVETHTDSNKKTTTYTYNLKGDLKSIEIQDSNSLEGKLVTIYDHDDYGDLRSVKQPDGSTQSIAIDYTSAEKTIKSTDPFGNLTTTKTDLLGNILESTDGKGNTQVYKYSAKNELTEVTNPKQKITTYGYDENGNITSILNARNFTSTYEYNGQNFLELEKNAINKIITYGYDDNGNLTDIMLPVNRTIHNKYDDLNRLTEIHSNGILKWKYNFEGDRLKSINQGTAIYQSFGYYENDYLKTVQEGSNLMEYEYKGEEYKSQVKYTVGIQESILNYELDDAYRMKALKQNGVTIANFHYRKDDGLPESISYLNGSSVSMAYEKGRLTDYIMKNKATDEFDAFKFGYDYNQNINKITSQAGVTDYDYDELNQLKIEILPDRTSLSYVYDEAGNRKEKSTTVNGVPTTIIYEYNGANQLIKVGSQHYQYDDNGNLTFDGTKTYLFNDFNELEAIKDASGQTIASYTYDEEGKRKSATISGGTVKYYYDGDQVLYETDENNNVLREYTYANGQPVTMTTTTTTTNLKMTYYYMVNHHGDVIALTDDVGNVVASYSYDAWGNILSQSGDMAEVNPYRYAGYRYDENTKLYYLMARYYNPDNGVFLSLDPIKGELQNPITLNGYNYANNNPVMNYDPDGRASKSLPYTIAMIIATGMLVKGLVKHSIKNVLKGKDKKKLLKSDLQFFASKFPASSISGKNLVKFLKKDGFNVVSQNGSHVKLKGPKGNIVVVPVHGNKDIPIGTLKSIKKQAGY